MSRSFEYLEKYEIGKNMYLNGASMTNIKKSLGFDLHCFRMNLKNDGVYIDANVDQGINLKAFEVIDNEFSAYWLGFIYADGYLSKTGNKFSVCIKDKEHMEKYKKFLNTRCQIRTKTVKGRPYYRLSIRNKKIYLDLIRNGCTPNKSLTIVFPTHLEEKMKAPFIRGYFDGDGCFSNTERSSIVISIIGTKEFLDYLREYLHLKNTQYARCGQAYEYRTTSKQYVRNFLDFIYLDANIYLERKYRKYKDAVLNGDI